MRTFLNLSAVGLAFGGGLLAVLVFTRLIGDALGLPIVYESWSEQRCVMVMDDGHEYSCENRPPKYTRIWVK